MSGFKRLSLGVAAVLLVAGAAGAYPDMRPSGKSPGADLPAPAEVPIDLIAKEVRLTDEQVAKMNTLAEQMEAALSEWRAANEAKLKDLKDKIVQAHKDGDEKAIRAAMEAQQALVSEYAKLAQDCRAKVVGVLTTEQRVAWEGSQLFNALFGFFKRFGLTDEQATLLRAQCDEAARKVIAGEDAKERHVARQELIQTIVEKVLTEEQRARFEAFQRAHGEGSSSSSEQVGPSTEGRGERKSSSPQP